ncbi:unnamed protein product [Dovyalis caffra]|uniref:Uncharacterized protein n=1 Tax=Dovyalis caffra TaxID=77055 RepID=A0AAV1QTC3_9ROSI|nr:unnamed protein product [Dovyalis caffra]
MERISRFYCFISAPIYTTHSLASYGCMSISCWCGGRDEDDEAAIVCLSSSCVLKPTKWIKWWADPCLVGPLLIAMALNGAHQKAVLDIKSTEIPEEK